MALLWKTTCDLRHPRYLRHPVRTHTHILACMCRHPCWRVHTHTLVYILKHNSSHTQIYTYQIYTHQIYTHQIHTNTHNYGHIIVCICPLLFLMCVYLMCVYLMCVYLICVYLCVSIVVLVYTLMCVYQIRTNTHNNAPYAHKNAHTHTQKCIHTLVYILTYNNRHTQIYTYHTSNTHKHTQ